LRSRRFSSSSKRRFVFSTNQENKLSPHQFLNRPPRQLAHAFVNHPLPAIRMWVQLCRLRPYFQEASIACRFRPALFDIQVERGKISSGDGHDKTAQHFGER
jgi:hypothetical protein